MIENFGKNLTRLRQEKNISQVELANELGIGKQSISDYEKQKTYPTFTNLEKIAVFFDATPTQIFGTSQEQELEINRKTIDEYEKKATHILEAANAIQEMEKKLFKVQPETTISDDGKILYKLTNSKTGETILSDNTINSEYDLIAKEQNLYTKILKLGDDIRYITRHISDEPIVNLLKKYSINNEK